MQSWVTWELSGNIQYMCMLDDAIYAVVRNGTTNVMQKINLKLSGEDGESITQYSNTHGVHLDNSHTISHTSTTLTYNSSANKTTFAMPEGFYHPVATTNLLANSEAIPSPVGSQLIENPLGVIEDIKANPDATTEDLETVGEIEQEMKDRRATKLWYEMAEVSSGGVQSNNVNSVSKTRRQYSSGEITSFNTAMFDRTYTNAMSLTAIRSIGEVSSFTINASFSDARQNVGTSDTADGYGLMLGYDTTIGNQSLSPYLMLSLIHISEPTRPY